MSEDPTSDEQGVDETDIGDGPVDDAGSGRSAALPAVTTTGREVAARPAPARDSAAGRGTTVPGAVRLGVAAVHPLLVTVPIGAFVCALAFDLASIWVETYPYARGAMWLVVIGLATSLVAGVVGMMDRRRRTRPTSSDRSLANRHLLLNGTAWVAFAVGLGVRRAELDTFLADGSPVPAVILSVVGVVLLAISALAGATLAAALDRTEADRA